jgi:hypothetical protein
VSPSPCGVVSFHAALQAENNAQVAVRDSNDANVIQVRPGGSGVTGNRTMLPCQRPLGNDAGAVNRLGSQAGSRGMIRHRARAGNRAYW